MLNEWFSLVIRASLLMLISGSCVALLSQFFPLTSPRWHRFAWGAVLLQGLILVPLSLTIEAPEWLAKHRLFAERQNRPDVSASESAPASVINRRTPHVVSPSIRVPDADQPTSHGEAVKAIRDSQHNRRDPSTGDALPGQIASVHASLDAELQSPEQDSRLHKNPPDIRSREPSGYLAAASGLVPSTDRWSAWVVPVWICGVIGLIGLGLLDYLILNVALLKTRPACRSWASELQDLSLELQLDRSVALDVHPVIGPLICWTPAGHRIVVPTGLWSELSTDERIAVLHHELSHLRRGDLWKSLLARMILALHWFNPLAWISARRFDESAEWACDALMASERPDRITQLANALLAATTARGISPMLAKSATGGPVYQRIRRLVLWDHRGDSLMKRLVWGGILCPLLCLGFIQLRFIEPLAAQATTVQEIAVSAAVQADQATDVGEEKTTSAEPDREAIQESARLREITERIVVGERENLKKFIELMKTPAGLIVMADRAAVQGQYATSDQDAISKWQQFVDSHFEDTGSAFSVKADFQPECDAYVRTVNEALADVTRITPALQEIAAALDTSTEPAQIMQRFLKHDGAPAFIYMQELRSRLHPGIEDLGNLFQEQLVRNKDGRYVIRPARRSMLEEQLQKVDRILPMLKRLEDELAAWSEDLADPDKRHVEFKVMLANPGFAVYLASGNLLQESEPRDEHFDDIFWRLEEATKEAPAGLILDVDSEQLKEMDAEIARFTALQERRSVLEEPLQELVNRLEVADELHRRLKDFLKTDLALLIVAREMDYSPVSAEESAREWLSNFVTRNDKGMYEITAASPEELVSRSEDFFQQYREVRRRGRALDEFAAKLTDKELQSAITTLSGKLILAELVERTAVRPDVDGLQLWFDAHFEETAEGLQLYDGSSGEVDAVLEEAAQLEEQLSKTDF